MDTANYHESNCRGQRRIVPDFPSKRNEGARLSERVNVIFFVNLLERLKAHFSMMLRGADSLLTLFN